ncbi:unnamed protein product, partial [Ectocarpus sp. 12 AP-2014]
LAFHHHLDLLHPGLTLYLHSRPLVRGFFAVVRPYHVPLLGTFDVLLKDRSRRLRGRRALRYGGSRRRPPLRASRGSSNSGCSSESSSTTTSGSSSSTTNGSRRDFGGT